MALVIDTSLSACSAGLFRGGEAIVSAVEPMARGHQERLPVLIAQLFDEAGITPRDLGHIGVTLGPGSFTGLRVGLSFAKGLATGLGLPLKGVGTLEALNRHPAVSGKTPLAVINGGRGQIYTQLGDNTPQAMTPEAASRLDADIVTGPAAAEVDLPGATVFPQDWPDLATLATLVLLPGHDDVTPLYLRGADAVASTRGIIRLEPAS